jgi:hypothetical protein
MDSQQTSGAIGLPNVDEDFGHLQGLINDRKRAVEEHRISQTSEEQGRRLGEGVAHIGGTLGNIALGFLNPAAALAKHIGGAITGGAVGREVGRFFGGLGNHKDEASRERAREHGGRVGQGILGFKKGGRVKKSGKALVHKKEFIVKSGIKVSKSQKMKVQKRKKTLKAPK